jgi:uncharacterized repeat protein (TIGR01451 family)
MLSPRLGGAAIALAVSSVVLVVPSALAAGTPDLTVAKTSDAVGAQSVGDRFTYSITVTNDGAATAHHVSIEGDLRVGLVPETIVPPCSPAGRARSRAPSAAADPPILGALRAGRARSGHERQRLVRGLDHRRRDLRLTNSAQVRASDEPASATGGDEASVTEAVSCSRSISIAPTAPRFTHLGATVHLSMLVRNDGHVSLTRVRVVDPGCAGPATRETAGDGDATLAPGEAWRYGCDRVIGADVGRALASTAIVTAHSPAGDVRAVDRRTFRCGSSSPARAPRRAIASSTATSCATTGTRPSPMSPSTNDHLGHIGDIATLAPGHTARLSALRVVSARRIWVVNVAIAVGTDPSGATIRDVGRAALTIVDAGSGSSPSGTDATAFTGTGAAAPASAMVILVTLGAAALLAARRRHS